MPAGGVASGSRPAQYEEGEMTIPETVRLENIRVKNIRVKNIRAENIQPFILRIGWLGRDAGRGWPHH
ncbi:hypothetical protein Phou_062610 [Phytohabitans houttuyneae]|uniref:Uncharacterized protein n=1 Tax=Phytohabitans houttuyneae TaxID=1076126 RepID=A0A6V8KHY5_9ACTN|nr:hypothetical protein Phou_062610 [Phytohabitans houttuyneae]